MPERITPRQKTLLAATLLTVGLAGCTPLAKMGVGPDIAQPGTRTTAGRLNDFNLAQSVRVDIYRDEPEAGNANIEVNAFYQVILLTGEVPTIDAKERIGEIARRYNDVKVVHNELTIGPSRSLAARLEDDLLERKAGFSLFTADGLRSSQAKVVAVNGTLYLMGKLSQREADRAIQRLQALDGLRRIIKIVDLVPEPPAPSETQATQQP